MTATALLAVALAGIAVWLHLSAGFTMPPPWDDEAHFVVPAMELAANGSLAPPLLNAPDGIFWLPHGYYVLLAPFVGMGDPVDAARWVSFASVVVFAVCIAATLLRRRVPAVLAVAIPGVWLLLPWVVITGNVARMEAPLLALAGVVLVLSDARRWPAATAVAALAPLLHPIGIVLVFVAVRGWYSARTSSDMRRIDLALGAAVVLAIAAQAIYFLANTGLAVEHLTYQLQRKAGRESAVGLLQLMILGAAAIGIVLLIRRIIPADRRRGASQTLWSLAAALMVVALVGQELWYRTLGVEAAALLAIVAMVSHVTAWDRLRLGSLLAAVAVLGIIGVSATTQSQFSAYDFDMHDRSRAEWAQFVTEAMDELRRYDSEPGPAEVVLMDAVSSMTPYVHGQDWKRLSFRQATPVTPLSIEDADLFLVGPRTLTGPQFAEWGDTTPRIRIVSPSGHFRLVVLPKEEATARR